MPERPISCQRIGEACRRALTLNLKAAAAARVPSRMLVGLDDELPVPRRGDYFELDPVTRAPALGDVGHRAHFEEVAGR